MTFGQKVQYSDEMKWYNLEIRIYQGADGEFILYEDEKNTYNYEKGVYSTITFKWNVKEQTLTISDRKGAFPGMLKSRTFNIVLVDKQNGVGNTPAVKFSKTLKFSGQSKVLKF